MTNKFIKLMYLLFGAATFENSALAWCTDHRRHHNRVDTSEDPYNINEGFFFAHIGWVFLKPKNKYANQFAEDLQNDPLVRWQHNNYLAIAIGVGFLLPALIGHLLWNNALAGFLFGGLLRVLVVQHCTFFINSLCHIWGYQTYSDENTAKDNMILALFTYGEGYHNFHHKFQADYRNGIRWYHFDPTKWWIRFLHFIGWAKRLIKTSEEDILKAKMHMVNLKITKKKQLALQNKDLLAQLKSQVEQRQKDWRRVKRDYEKFKIEMNQKRQEMLAQLKLAQKDKMEHFQQMKQEKIRHFRQMRQEKMQSFRDELKNSQLEFQLAYSQWRACTKVLLQS